MAPINDQADRSSMLPDELKPVFLEFFSEVDRYISYEVTETKGRIGEVTTTARLLRCFDLDEDTGQPDGLKITPVQFQKDLAALAEHLPGRPEVAFAIEAEEFTQNFEGQVTQADYALRLSYTDTSKSANIPPNQSWETFYFFQAKIARPPGRDADRKRLVWGANAAFGVTDGQASAVQSAQKLLGIGLIYNLYCPLHALELDQAAISYRKLRDYLSDRPEDWEQAKTAGLWISRRFPSTLGELLNSDEVSSQPWVLFLLEHYFSPSSQDAWRPEFMFADSNYPLNSPIVRRKRLFDRDQQFIKLMQKFLVDEGARKKIRHPGLFEEIGFRPRIEISIKFPGFDYVNIPKPAPSGPSFGTSYS